MSRMKKVQHPPALSALVDEKGFYGVDYVFNVIEHKICDSIYWLFLQKLFFRYWVWFSFQCIEHFDI